jgi:hypothetical protein
MGTVRRIGRDVVAGSVAIGLVVAATYLASRAFIPSASPDTTEASRETPTAADALAEVAELFGSNAVIYASGALEQRLILDGKIPSIVFGPGPDPSSYDIDIQYQGSGTQLTLAAKGITVGEPRTDRILLVLTIDGMNFNAHSGDCTLLVTHFEYSQSSDGTSRLIASFSGALACTDLSELRSDQTLSFTGAFDR